MKIFHLEGVATVTVFAVVEARTAEDAIEIAKDDRGLWQCEDIDGDVLSIAITLDEDGEDPDHG